MKSNRESDLAYCAGIIDGEGCFCISKRHKTPPQWLAVIAVTMVTKEPLLFLQRILSGHISGSGKTRTGKRQWHWAIEADKAKTVAKLLLPRLLVKQAQAKLLIAFREHVDQVYLSRRKGLRLLESDILMRDQFRKRMQGLNA